MGGLVYFLLKEVISSPPPMVSQQQTQVLESDQLLCKLGKMMFLSETWWPDTQCVWD